MAPGNVDRCVRHCDASKSPGAAPLYLLVINGLGGAPPAVIVARCAHLRMKQRQRATEEKVARAHNALREIRGVLRLAIRNAKRGEPFWLQSTRVPRGSRIS